MAEAQPDEIYEYAAFPSNYRFFFKERSKVAGSPRVTDFELYGHASGKGFISSIEAMPHVYYLERRSRGLVIDSSVCECHLCREMRDDQTTKLAQAATGAQPTSQLAQNATAAYWTTDAQTAPLDQSTKVSRLSLS